MTAAEAIARALFGPRNPDLRRGERIPTSSEVESGAAIIASLRQDGYDVTATPEKQPPGEPIRAVGDDYLGARCGLPACGEPLHIVWTLGMGIYLSNTAAELGDPAHAHTSTWHVECEGGHTILQPPPTAEDSYTFGACRCEPTDPSADGDCGHGDLARLRRVLDPRAEMPYWSVKSGGAQRTAKVGDRLFVITECSGGDDGKPWEIEDSRPGVATKLDYFPTLTEALSECELRAGITSELDNTKEAVDG